MRIYGAISVHNSLADLRQDGTAATGASNRCLYNGSAKTLIELINEVPGSADTGLRRVGRRARR